MNIASFYPFSLSLILLFLHQHVMRRWRQPDIYIYIFYLSSGKPQFDYSVSLAFLSQSIPAFLSLSFFFSSTKSQIFALMFGHCQFIAQYIARLILVSCVIMSVAGKLQHYVLSYWKISLYYDHYLTLYLTKRTCRIKFPLLKSSMSCFNTFMRISLCDMHM